MRCASSPLSRSSVRGSRSRSCSRASIGRLPRKSRRGGRSRSAFRPTTSSTCRGCASGRACSSPAGVWRARRSARISCTRSRTTLTTSRAPRREARRAVRRDGARDVQRPAAPRPARARLARGRIGTWRPGSRSAGTHGTASSRSSVNAGSRTCTSCRTPSTRSVRGPGRDRAPVLARPSFTLSIGELKSARAPSRSGLRAGCAEAPGARPLRRREGERRPSGRATSPGRPGSRPLPPRQRRGGREGRSPRRARLLLHTPVTSADGGSRASGSVPRRPPRGSRRSNAGSGASTRSPTGIGSPRRARDRSRR